MTVQTTAREIMVDVFEYPHIPYWFTLRQAAGIIRNTLLGGEKHVRIARETERVLAALWH